MCQNILTITIICKTISIHTVGTLVVFQGKNNFEPINTLIGKHIHTDIYKTLASVSEHE